MRIQALGPHFAPDSAPTGEFMTAIVEGLARRGHEVFATLCQTIQAGTRQKRVAKEVGPFTRRTIGGQHDAAFFITFIDDVIQIFGHGRLQGLQAKIIQRQ